MIIMQGDIAVIGVGKTSELDGLLLEAKVDGETIGSIPIGQNLSARYSGLELGPNKAAEGGIVEFWIGNQKALETAIFGKLTVEILKLILKLISMRLLISKIEPNHGWDIASLPL